MTRRGIAVNVSDCDGTQSVFLIPDEWVAQWAHRLAGGRTAPVVAEINRCLEWMDDKGIVPSRDGLQCRIETWLNRFDLWESDGVPAYGKTEVSE